MLTPSVSVVKAFVGRWGLTCDIEAKELFGKFWVKLLLRQEGEIHETFETCIKTHGPGFFRNT